jgi:hypothetical protein
VILPLYMDHQVPVAVTQGLRRLGIEVLSAQEDGAEAWDDDKILERATRLQRTLFSEDEDFLTITDNWRQAGRDFAGLVYAHQLNLTIGRAVADLELIAKVMEPHDMLNQVIYIPF